MYGTLHGGAVGPSLRARRVAKECETKIIDRAARDFMIGAMLEIVYNSYLLTRKDWNERLENMTLLERNDIPPFLYVYTSALEPRPAGHSYVWTIGCLSY